MIDSFLQNDAMMSIEDIKSTLSKVGISSFHIAAYLRKLGRFLSSSFESLCDEQVRFVSSLESIRENDVPPTTFEEEIAKANWFLPHDSYIKLCIDVACIADYVVSISDEYSERFAQSIIKAVKDQFLLPLQKENKGLALVYLANQ